MENTPKWYDAHLSEYQKTAFINSRETYDALYRQSIDNPEIFWAEQAKKYLSWEKEWSSVLEYDFEEGHIEWFKGGVINATYNCLDRHLEENRDKICLLLGGG